MKSRRLIWIVAVTCIWSFSLNAFGQTAKDMEILTLRAREKVGMLNDYIGFMANKSWNVETRSFYKEAAEGLFINNCDSYVEMIQIKNMNDTIKIEREGVTMDVSSTLNNTIKTKLIKSYFEGLMRLNYKSVDIESTDIADMRVSRLRPYGKGENGNLRYICSVYFDQRFVGYRKDGGIYKDITHKWVVCFVDVDDVLDSDTGEIKQEYMVSLGDVHVQSTEEAF
jgi:hypothetical protein